MSTPDERSEEERIVSEVEKIARMAFGEFTVEEYQAMLFNVGAMLAVYRAAMVETGYSQYFIEISAWMIITSMFGQHLQNQRIDFAPPDSTYQVQAGRTQVDATSAQAQGPAREDPLV